MNEPILTRQPLIVAVAPNGAKKNKQDHPNIPLSQKEITETALEIFNAGASMIHLHIRDNNGQHTLDSKIYLDTISSIRQEIGMKLIIQITTESVGIYTPSQQIKSVKEVKPEAASISIREIETPDNHSELQKFFHWCAEQKILLQYILYSEEDLKKFLLLKKSKIIPEINSSVLIVLGKNSQKSPQPKDLLPFLNTLENDNTIWSTCSFGKSEAACCLTSIALGGHVRVGFENNINLINGSIAPNNAALVSQIVKNLDALNRSLADADKAREILKI